MRRRRFARRPCSWLARRVGTSKRTAKSVIWRWPVRIAALWCAWLLVPLAFALLVPGALNDVGGLGGLLSTAIAGVVFFAPVVAVFGLVMGLVAWLALRATGRSTVIPVAATGVAAVVLVTVIGAWVSRGTVSVRDLLLFGAPLGVLAALVTRRDVRLMGRVHSPRSEGARLHS